MRAGAAAALAIAAAAVAGCGGGGDKKAAPRGIVWDKTPLVFRTPALPRDRVVFGSIRNTGKRPLILRSQSVRVRDARGHVQITTARFVHGYAHGLYGAFQQPSELPPGELTRMGYVVAVFPGKAVPLTVSFRLAKDARLPATVDLAGRARLAVPTKYRPTAR